MKNKTSPQGPFNPLPLEGVLPSKHLLPKGRAIMPRPLTDNGVKVGAVIIDEMSHVTPEVWDNLEQSIKNIKPVLVSTTQPKG